MEITDELVEHLERLSKLKLREEEIEKMKKDMKEILEYMKLLDEVDVEGYSPLFTPIEDPMRLRKDEPVTEDPSKILELVPRLKGDFISVPSIYAK
ncbi:Asp-tRNA(Asn)/Glu-tRNA(Gln) amidotransferase subunit GatC [Athalassotoga saccharophila]|uniref:Asp-tRNA(Asn)/Glu-tRNA(Gln) amidotransferase subunit GatC n=1 Tax=Athalassotoga saccharophila TaxID=1441386 RepID=UPI00137A0C39|nr:Asp-tRNA(Asn)/Glu-tRNA(Gln) amidotransferase subunit GatC [Athalassotoga saccharophila]BBJ27400.1 glutamyl-tRNA(Gln) amidotransferase subunit C [Athalassotoga saccharophila]